MKKVLIITYYWPPSGGAGVQRMLKFVKYLSSFGIQPIVITVDENKASYQLSDRSLLKDIPENIRIIKTATFEPFEFYKFFGRKKEIPHSGFANETNPGLLQQIMRFIRGNFFIPDARKGWNKYAYKAAIDVLKKENIAAIITSSPPHSTQVLGLKLKKLSNLPWIADLRDPWTDIYYYKQMLHTAVAKKIDADYERAVLENSDAIMVVSQDIKRIFANKTAKDISGKIYVIPNGYDEADFETDAVENQNEFSITYTGTFADIYVIDAFIDAFKKITEKYKDVNLKVKFIGKVSGSLMQKAEAADLSRYFSFTPYVPHNESVKALLGSTVLLLVIPKMDKNEGILTGKLFEYLGSEKPIICIGPPNGDAAQIIADCKAGKTFDYEDADAIYSYLNELIISYKEHKIGEYKSQDVNKYSRRKLTGKLAEIIDNITKA